MFSEEVFVKDMKLNIYLIQKANIEVVFLSTRNAELCCQHCL